MKYPTFDLVLVPVLPSRRHGKLPRRCPSFQTHVNQLSSASNPGALTGRSADPLPPSCVSLPVRPPMLPLQLVQSSTQSLPPISRPTRKRIPRDQGTPGPTLPLQRH